MNIGALFAFFGLNRPGFRSKVGHSFGANRPPPLGAALDNNGIESPWR